MSAKERSAPTIQGVFLGLPDGSLGHKDVCLSLERMIAIISQMEEGG